MNQYIREIFTTIYPSDVGKRELSIWNCLRAIKLQGPYESRKKWEVAKEFWKQRGGDYNTRMQKEWIPTIVQLWEDESNQPQPSNNSSSSSRTALETITTYSPSLYSSNRQQEEKTSNAEQTAEPAHSKQNQNDRSLSTSTTVAKESASSSSTGISSEADTSAGGGGKLLSSLADVLRPR